MERLHVKKFKGENAKKKVKEKNKLCKKPKRVK